MGIIEGDGGGARGPGEVGVDVDEVEEADAIGEAKEGANNEVSDVITELADRVGEEVLRASMARVVPTLTLQMERARRVQWRLAMVGMR